MRPKLQFFAWRLICKMLPSSGKLRNLRLSVNGDCLFRFKDEENIDQIFSKCDLTTTVWHTIDNYCPNPTNTNLAIVHWLEYLWKNKS